MSYCYDKKTFHRLLLIICRGSENREDYNFTIDTVFENMQDEQRDYYWETYCDMQGIAKVIDFLKNTTVTLTTDSDLPENVIPIRPT